MTNLAEAIEMSWVPSGKHKATENLANGTDKKVKVDVNKGKKKKVGVLISGTGIFPSFFKSPQPFQAKRV